MSGNNLNFRDAVAGQNKPAANPAPLPSNNNNNQQNNSQDLQEKITNLVQRVTAIKNPIVQFITQTEPDFIRDLLAKIQEIQNSLNQIAIDDALVDRVAALKVRTNNAFTEIDRLNNELRSSQQQYQQAMQLASKLQAEVDQGKNQYSNLEREKARIDQLYETNNTIMNNAIAAIENFQREIAELERLTTQITTNTEAQQRVKDGLDSLNTLVNAKLSAYQRMMGELPQQGGKRSKGKRRTKKMRGGYSYPSAGYEGAQEIVVASSRSAKSAPSRRSARSRRQSKRRPRTI